MPIGLVGNQRIPQLKSLVKWFLKKSIGENKKLVTIQPTTLLKTLLSKSENTLLTFKNQYFEFCFCIFQKPFLPINKGLFKAFGSPCFFVQNDDLKKS